MRFTKAETVEEALHAMAAGARPIAGGSDLMVAARQGKSPLPESIVAIDRIPALSRMDADERSMRIGAAVSHAQLEVDPRIVADYTALADAAALVGSPATRHVGTIGGNIMNGSPAMDTGAPLVVLDGRVELRSLDRTRQIDISEMWTGPGQSVAAVDELCTAILLPERAPRSGSGYVRLEYRRAMEIAVVGAAASVTLAPDGDLLAAISVALTAVAPTIVSVEIPKEAIGRPVDDDLLDRIAVAASERAQPISDVRASARYRKHIVGVMARRAAASAFGRARGETIGVPLNRTAGIGAP